MGFPLQPFVPARGLEAAHAQTVFAHVFRPTHVPPVERQRWELPDGDFLDVDRLHARRGRPHLLVLHGLEGSSSASYVAAILRGAAARGWGALAMNFRSCSGDNRLLRSYFAGETGDAAFCAARLRAEGHGPIWGVGFSLGASALLRLQADAGADAPLDAAAAISTPWDLAACGRELDANRLDLNVLYRLRFVLRLRGKALRKARRHPGGFDADRVRRTLGLREFDDAFTAPVHGFAGVDDYYARCSAAPRIPELRRPTLLISAADDPMVPGRLFPAVANPLVTPLLTSHGGHVGFVAGSVLRPRYWAETTALEYFDQL